MARIEENTVSSANQLKKEESVFGKGGSGKRILFLGNSITKHGISESIGWLGNWGMAASSEDKDYVHQTMTRVYTEAPDASFLVAQISLWERSFWDKQVILDNYAEALNYHPDIIIMRVCENVPIPELEKHDFKAGYEMMLDMMNPDGKAKIILTSPFWPSEKHNTVIEAVAKERVYDYVYLSDLGSNDIYLARDKFEHPGVGAHPGDRGMEAIAERIFEVIKKYL